MGSFGQEVLEIARGIVDLLLPPCCAGCGKGIPAGVLCEACAALVEPVASPRCPVCALPFDGAGIDHVCGRCVRSPPAFASATAAFRYEGPIADGLRALKYGPRPERIAGLAALWREVAVVPEADLAVPVPLHPRRLRQRGFNQSVLLARPLLRASRLRLDTSSLRRVVDGPPQASLQGAERTRAMARAFVVPERQKASIAERTILLVDDVMTTGATAGACARALLGAGAAEIHVAVLARA